jgi:hypothetical protein
VGKIKVLLKRYWKLFSVIITGSVIAAILNFASLLNTVKDVISYVVELSKPEPEEWISEKDGNIRGLILAGADTYENAPLTIHYGKFSPLRVKREDLILGRDNICLSDMLHYSTNDCMISFELDDNNHLLVSGKFYDTNQCLMVTVDRGQFILSPECTYTYNKDDYGFEIVDSTFNVVFSIDGIGNNEVIIKGAFISETRYLVFSDYSFSINELERFDPETFDQGRKKIKPIFRYYGTDWFGRRAKD